MLYTQQAIWGTRVHVWRRLVYDAMMSQVLGALQRLNCKQSRMHFVGRHVEGWEIKLRITVHSERALSEKSA